jgi:hypothetical protein
MPRVKRTLESQSLYIKMLEKLAKDFAADLAKAKEIYNNLEQIEQTKQKQITKTSKNGRPGKVETKPKRLGRSPKVAENAAVKKGRTATTKVAAAPKKRAGPQKAK